MKIGFTGTQNGMSEKQKKVLFNLIESFPYAEYHHGDCIGADANFHTIVSDLIHETIGRIIIHPPINKSKRAWCTGGKVLQPKPYLIRDRDIVNSVDWLIACPYKDVEKIRSGTWFTVRYARKQVKNITIIFPSGRIKRYE